MSQTKETIVRIAGIDVPIHLAWQKIEALNTGAEVLEQLNQKYPHLASDFTCEITSIVRDRIKDCIGDAKIPAKADIKLVEFLVEKLEADIDPLDIVDITKREKDVDITLEDLVYIVGEKTYMEAMLRQAKMFHENKILPEQIAELWNQASLPAPGKQHWTKKDLEKMLGTHESSGWD